MSTCPSDGNAANAAANTSAPVSSSSGNAGPKIVLLIIDPQNDFHKAGGQGELAHAEGSLAVPGANEDSERIATMIDENIDKISDIYITMDSHHVCNLSRRFKAIDF